MSYVIPNRVDEKLRPLLDKILLQKEALETVLVQRTVEEGPNQTHTEAALIEASDRIISGGESLYSESAFGGSTRRESIFGKSVYIHGWIADAAAIDDLSPPVEDTEPSSVFSGTQNEHSSSSTDDTASAGRVADVTSSTLSIEEVGTGVDEPYSDDEFAIEAAQYAIHDGRTAFEKDDYAEASKSLQEALKMVRELPSSRQTIYDACDIRYMLGVCCFHLQEPREAREALFAIVHNTPRAKVQDDKRRHQVLNTGHLLAQTDVRLNNLELARSICHQTLQGRAKLLSKTHELYYESLALLSRIVELQGNAQRAKIIAKMLPEDQKKPLIEKFAQLTPISDTPAVINIDRGSIPVQSGNELLPKQSATRGSPSEAQFSQSSTDVTIPKMEHDSQFTSVSGEVARSNSTEHKQVESRPAKLPKKRVPKGRSEDIPSKEETSNRSLSTEDMSTKLAVETPTPVASPLAPETPELANIPATFSPFGAEQPADANEEQELVQRSNLAQSTPSIPRLENSFEPSHQTLESKLVRRSISLGNVEHATHDGTVGFHEFSSMSYANPALKELVRKSGYRRPPPADTAARKFWIAALCETSYESIMDRLRPDKSRDILAISILRNVNQAETAAKLGRTVTKDSLFKKAGHLLKYGALWESPLHLACLYGDTKVVESLIRTKAKLDIICKPGFTALHCAAIGGNYDAAKLLVDAGCSVDVDDWHFRDALCWALLGQRLDIIDLLWGNDASQSSFYLQLACSTGNVHLLKALFPGEMLSKRTSYLLNWFDWARTFIAPLGTKIRRPRRHMEIRNRRSIGKMSILSCSEATPLFIAAHLGCGEIIKHLLSIGCDPKAKCNVKCRRSVGKVTLMGEEVFRRDFSPVQAACLAGRETIVRQLLEAGAASQEVAETCLIFDQQRWDGLLVAVAVDSSECAVALLDHGVQIRVDVLRWILEDGKVDIMRTLVDYGIPMAVAAMTLKSELSQTYPGVIKQNSEECLRSLILGVEGVASYIWVPDSATTGSTEDGTLLHFIEADKAIFAKLLIEVGASIDARNSKGETPLMLAAQKGNHPVVEVLLANGASQHAQNNKGRSAVQYALDAGNRKVIERFLRPVHDPT